MTCEWFKVGPDAVAVVCNRGKRWPRCSVPGCDRPAPFLCDFPVGRKKSGTCDAKLCEGHRAQQGEERDFCPPHARQPELPARSAP
jgi:hypothetical protein